MRSPWNRGVAGTVLLAAVPAVVAFALSSCSRPPSREVSRRLQEAQSVFLRAEGPEDYLHAAALYQEILDGGFVSGAVLFNQGNAFMRAGKRGFAVAAYRRAQRYRARDPYLRNNLEQALGGALPPKKRTLIDYLFFWLEWLSYPEVFRAAAAAAGAAFVLAFSGLLWRLPAPLKRVTRVVFAAALLLIASAAVDFYRYDVVRHGVIVAAETEARKGNAESFAPAFSTKLKEGDEFVLREERGDWLLIRLPQGPEGWIRKESAVLY